MRPATRRPERRGMTDLGCAVEPKSATPQYPPLAERTLRPGSRGTPEGAAGARRSTPTRSPGVSPTPLHVLYHRTDPGVALR